MKLMVDTLIFSVNGVRISLLFKLMSSLVLHFSSNTAKKFQETNNQCSQQAEQCHSSSLNCHCTVRYYTEIFSLHLGHQRGYSILEKRVRGVGGCGCILSHNIFQQRCLRNGISGILRPIQIDFYLGGFTKPPKFWSRVKGAHT